MKEDRKGISPLISAVLLIAFAMAVIGILMAWGTNLFQTQTGTISNQTTETVDCAAANIRIFGVSDNTNWANVTVENTGQQDYSNVSVTALAGNSILGTEYIGSLSSSELGAAQVKTDGTQPDEVRVASKNCPSDTDSETF